MSTRPIDVRARQRPRRHSAGSSTTCTSATPATRTGSPPLRIGEHERLNPKKNPFFAHADVELLLAWRGDRVVGRIAAIDDRLHQETHHDNVAMFGFFEADDGEVGRGAAGGGRDAGRRRAAARGARTDQPVDERDVRPAHRRLRHRPDAADAAQPAGVRRADRVGRLRQGQGSRSPGCTCCSASCRRSIVRAARRLRDKHRITVRPLNLGEFAREIERLREIYCGAWERNWGFVPPTDAEFRRIATELKPIFDPRCAVCAEVDGRMVACAVAVPDINQALKGTNGRLFPLGLIRLLRRKRYITQVRLLLLGIAERYRGLGLYPAADRRVAPAAAGHAVRARRVLVGARGQPRHQPAGGSGRRAPLQDLPHLPEGAVTQRVAVTGASGFIGRHLARASRRARHRGRSRCGVRSSGARCSRHCAASDAVVHLAGVVSALREQDYITANVDGTRAVAEAARAAGVAADPRLEPRGRRSGAAARAALRGRSARADQRLRPQQARGRARVAAIDGSALDHPAARRRSTDRAIAPCCRCSRWPRAASCRSSDAPTRRTPSSTSHDLGAGDRRGGRSAGRRRHDLRRPSATRSRRASCSRRSRRAPARARSIVRVPLARHPRWPPSAGDLVGRLPRQPLLINSRRYAELASEGFVCRVDRLRDRLGVVAAIGSAARARGRRAWYRQEGWL